MRYLSLSAVGNVALAGERSGGLPARTSRGSTCRGQSSQTKISVGSRSLAVGGDPRQLMGLTDLAAPMSTHVLLLTALGDLVSLGTDVCW